MQLLVVPESRTHRPCLLAGLFGATGYRGDVRVFVSGRAMWNSHHPIQAHSSESIFNIKMMKEQAGNVWSTHAK